MLNLTYTQKPEDGDKGSVFWDVLANLFSLYDDHVHDGTTSDAVSAKHVVKSTQLIDSAPWALDSGNGLYQQTVTMPSGTAFDDIHIEFTIVASTGGENVGEKIHPTVLKMTASTYKLWVIDSGCIIRADYR